jgi:hypothetical protein
MSASVDLEATLDGWLRLFTDLASTNIPSDEELSLLATPDVRFKDPFQDVCGYASIRQVLAHTQQSISDLRFEVLERAWFQGGVYVKWVMNGQLATLGQWQVEGLSEIIFSEEGRVSSHIDYWDASEQFYGRLPIIGWLLRRIRSAASS